MHQSFLKQCVSTVCLCKIKRKILNKIKNALPDVIFFRRGRLLSDVTLLLSTDKSTDGNGVGVSECDLS